MRLSTPNPKPVETRDGSGEKGGGCWGVPNLVSEAKTLEGTAHRCRAARARTNTAVVGRAATHWVVPRPKSLAAPIAAAAAAAAAAAVAVATARAAA